jgi:hypothetical protein
MALLTAANSKLIIASRKIQGHSGRIGGGARSDSAQNVLIIDKINAADSGQTTLTQHTRRVFVGFCPPTASDYANANIGDKYLEFQTDDSNGLLDYSEYAYGANGWVSTSGAAKAIVDPGDAGAIPVTASGTVPLVSGGSGETRSLADASYPGQILNLCFKTDGGGDVVVTAASPVNQTGNDEMTFADAGDQIVLMAIEDGSDYEWRVLANDGVALATS